MLLDAATTKTLGVKKKRFPLAAALLLPLHNTTATTADTPCRPHFRGAYITNINITTYSQHNLNKTQLIEIIVHLKPQNIIIIHYTGNKTKP